LTIALWVVSGQCSVSKQEMVGENFDVIIDEVIALIIH
jgi:hypothetical protein